MAVVKKCVGIDLGNDSIKVAELVCEKNTVRLLKAAYANLEIPQDASRADRNKMIVNVLRGLLRSNRINTKEAVFCVPGQTVFVRRFRLPKTTEERLSRIINYEARQQIPFPIEKTMLEYQISEMKGEMEVEVFVVALKKDVLHEFMDLVDKTGLKPLGISVSTLALFNYHSLDSLPAEKMSERLTKGKRNFAFNLKLPPFLTKLKKGGKSVQETAPSELKEKEEEEAAASEIVRAYLNIGATMTDLTIGTSGLKPTLGFTRSIPLAGNTMTQAIMEHCQGVSDIKEAERIKRESTVILTPYAETEPSVNEQASEAATGVVDRIIAELRRSLDFYISQPDGVAVDEIILSGGQAQLPNLAKYIEDKLGIPVKQYEAPFGQNIKGIESTDKDIIFYPIAIGLALAGIGLASLQVDFLPPERKVAIRFKKKRGFVLVLAGLVCGTIILGAMSGDHYIAIYREQTVQYQDEYTKYDPIIKRIESVTKVEEDLKTKFDKLSIGLTTERDYPLQRWLDVLKAKPADVLISSLKVFPDGTVIVEGYTEDQNSAVKFSEILNTDLLEKRHLLEGKGARLVDIKTEFNELFKKDVSKFTINMKYKGRYSRVQEVTPETVAPGTPPERGPVAPAAPIGPARPMPSGRGAGLPEEMI
jgi:type IV pilus assembly protein PilM